MSLPTMPDYEPKIKLDMEDSIKMIMNSISMEEIGLSHIINAEGEKIQYAVQSQKLNCECSSNYYDDTDRLIKINNSIDRTLKTVLRNQLILQMKLEETMDFYREYKDDFNCNYNDDTCYKDEECFNKLFKKDKNNDYDGSDLSVDCSPKIFDYIGNYDD